MALFGKKKVTGVKVRKRDIPDGLWIKCPACSEMVFKQELAAALNVCPRCEYHFQLPRRDRIALLSEPGSFQEWDGGLASVDSLGFSGTASYAAKLKENEQKTGYHDAISCGRARLGRHAIALGVMDFEFLGASMGAVVGEKVARLVERGTAERLPVIISCASGGARMYEGLYSLMQMAKTSAVLARHAAARLPYLTILTHPTTAGVMASFASLGDVILAEPGALIGFAGPRVIESTVRVKLPAGFQRAEFLQEKGAVDFISDRRELRKTIASVLAMLTRQPADAVG